MKNLTISRIFAGILVVGVLGYLYGMVGSSMDEAIDDAQIERAWQMQAQRGYPERPTFIKVKFGNETLNVTVKQHETVADLKEMLSERYNVDEDNFELYAADGRQLHDNEKIKNIGSNITTKMKISRPKVGRWF